MRDARGAFQENGGGAALAPLLTPDDVAALLRVSRGSVYKFVRSGVLPCVAVGNKYRFRRDEVAAWLEKGGHH